MTDPEDRPLAGQPWLEAPASRQVLAALTAGGRPARFVGGCVRDGLLGRVAAGLDLDLATPEPPERVMELLRAKGIRAVPTGLEHGTVTAVIDRQHFEITTLRRDVATDGRRAQVAFTEDFEVDAARRDFTINAMSCDASGRLYDYFGGRKDLAAGRIRFVGEPALRISEDYLRILRFFRFFAHYGRGPADAAGLAAAAAAAPEMRRLSGERVQAEMLKLLAAPDPLPSLRLMLERRVLEQVMPLPVALERLARLIARVRDADPLLRLGALLRPPPASADAASGVSRRWRLAKRDALRLERMTGDELPALAAPATERRRTLHGLGRERYLDLLRLAATETDADDRGSLGEAIAFARGWAPPSLPVSGSDLLAIGLSPGPPVGELLRALEAWWVAQDFEPDRAACLNRARELVAASGRSEKT